MYTKDYSSIIYAFTIRLRYERNIMSASPPSYLAPFEPNVYVFEQSCGKIAYSEHPTGNDVSSKLTSQFQNIGTCMKCLTPANDNGEILDPDCEQTWLNINEPVMQVYDELVEIPLYQQYLTDIVNAKVTSLEKSLADHHPEFLEKKQSDVSQIQQLISQLKQSTTNPDSLYSLRQAFVQACESGIYYEQTDTTPTTYAKSVLTLLQEAIETPKLPAFLSPSDPTTKIQFTQPATSENESVSDAIQRGIRYYNSERNQFNNIIHNIVTANKTLNDAIVNNYQTITALQKKIDLAYQVLQAEGNKLHELTHNYANARAQTEQNRHNRVAIGFPYMDPMFTMSQRNYVIMMLCFIVMLVIGILVYAFVGRKRHTGDVVGTTDGTGTATSGSGAATTTTGQ